MVKLQKISIIYDNKIILTIDDEQDIDDVEQCRADIESKITIDLTYKSQTNGKQDQQRSNLQK